LNIENCLFLGYANFEFSYVEENIKVIDSKFFNDADFSGISFVHPQKINHAIEFENTVFLGRLLMDNLKLGNLISFSQTYFKKGLSLNRIEASYLKFNNIFLNDKLILNPTKPRWVLDIKQAVIGKSKLIIEPLGIPESGMAKIKNLTSNNYSSSIKLEFHLTQNVIITDSNLSNFKNICFDGNIEDVRFINVNWGEVSKERFCPDITDYRKKRDIFRQIKLALDKQENYIDARKFYALEMWAYGRELCEELKSHLNLKSSLLVLLFIILASIPFFLLHAPWGIIASSLVMGALALTSYKLINRFNFVKDAVRIWENFTEMIIYWFYQATSNFGLNWKRPILWLIIITPIYFELVNRKEQIRNAFERFSDFVPLLGKLLWQVFDNLNYISAKFLQSLSLFNSSTMQSNSNGIAFITLLYYSFSAYLIYQFVMAIRRKVRR